MVIRVWCQHERLAQLSRSHGSCCQHPASLMGQREESKECSGIPFCCIDQQLHQHLLRVTKHGWKRIILWGFNSLIVYNTSGTLNKGSVPIFSGVDIQWICILHPFNHKILHICKLFSTNCLQSAFKVRLVKREKWRSVWRLIHTYWVGYLNNRKWNTKNVQSRVGALFLKMKQTGFARLQRRLAVQGILFRTDVMCVCFRLCLLCSHF